MKKYQYWTFVTKVGKEFINKIKIGDHISADYKKKEWEIIDDKGRISFMGSGTTAVASKQLNRNFIGFEISKEYCDIANKRLEQSNIKEFV